MFLVLGINAVQFDGSGTGVHPFNGLALSGILLCLAPLMTFPKLIMFSYLYVVS